MPESSKVESIVWQAPEFTYRHKSVSWYWLSIIVAVFLIATAVWQRNFLFGLFVAIAEILVLVWGSREPALVTFRLAQKEFVINDQIHYAWADFVSFSAEEGAEGFSVLLRFRSSLRPPLRIFVPRNYYSEFKKRISLWCPETHDLQSFVDVMEELFRF